VSTSRARTTWLAFAALAMLAFFADRMRTRVTGRVAHAKEAEDVYPLPAPEQLKVACIGYDDAIASILWASLLYQYGDHVGKNRAFPYASAYARTIVHLDPNLKQVYRFLGTFVTMQSTSPELREIVAVREILEQGLETYPSDPDVWGAYASFMMFEATPTLPDDQKKRWRVVGAGAAQRAVELGYKIDTLGYTGALFLERNGYRDLAIAQLRRSYSIAPDEATRTKILRKLERLQAANVAEALSREYETFRGRWAQEGAFVTESTFTLIGPARDVAACAGRVGIDPACAFGFGATAATPLASPH
jgi:tetratricopeptide (TPR) repeat protein